jgi:ankyrin repeat protein
MLEIVEDLLQRNAEPNTGNKQGYTALMVAVHPQHPEIAQALLEKGANANFAE